ncbi:hydroxyethylthiazole kinase [Atopobiaceae bacterium HCP3S3_D6]
MLGSCLDRVREASPLVHCITNYVTVNDVANAILAVGASPIMSDEPEEVADITAICDALDLNIGTLNRLTIEGMRRAGARARELGHVVLLDPVGAGASPLRTRTALELLELARPDVVRGNASEVRALALGTTSTHGVDAAAADAVSEQNLDAMVEFAKGFAADVHATVAITGAIDLVADAGRCFVIRNGRPEMSRITGTGCQLSGVICAFVAAARAAAPAAGDVPAAGTAPAPAATPASSASDTTAAVAAAVACMGLAGEVGRAHLAPHEGNATLRNRIIDALSHLDGAALDGGERYELR